MLASADSLVTPLMVPGNLPSLSTLVYWPELHPHCTSRWLDTTEEVIEPVPFSPFPDALKYVREYCMWLDYQSVLVWYYEHACLLYCYIHGGKQGIKLDATWNY